MSLEFAHATSDLQASEVFNLSSRLACFQWDTLSVPRGSGVAKGDHMSGAGSKAHVQISHFDAWARPMLPLLSLPSENPTLTDLR